MNHNNLGIITVTKQLIQDDPVSIVNFFKSISFLPLQIEQSFALHAMCYRGTCPFFDEVKAGDRVPDYSVDELNKRVEELNHAKQT